MNNKPYSESSIQNQVPILEVLKHCFKYSHKVLEIGSGTGQHACYFPRHLPHLEWQPSDLNQNLAGIEAWCSEASLENVATVIELDVSHHPWPTIHVDAVFSANTVHIMHWPDVINLFKGIGQLFRENPKIDGTGVFCLYGPFNYDGKFTSESNARFDQWLKQRDPHSGVRDIENIITLAEQNSLQMSDDIEMPANNRTLVFTSR